MSNKDFDPSLPPLEPAMDAFENSFPQSSAAENTETTDQEAASSGNDAEPLDEASVSSGNGAASFGEGAVSAGNDAASFGEGAVSAGNSAASFDDGAFASDESSASLDNGSSSGQPSSDAAGEAFPHFYGRQYDQPDPVVPEGWDTKPPRRKRDYSRLVLALKNNWAELTIILSVLLIMITWSFVVPHYLPGGPDEPMRNLICKWLYKNPGKLPMGDEKAIRSETWGLSYGYYPLLSYMVSAFFMMIGGIFTKSEAALLHIARLADVMFLTIAAGFVIKAGKKLFGREQGLFFACMVIFLPGFHYMGTYVNNESLALMACAIIFCSWAGAYKEGWQWKNVILLGVGIGLCAMSYYSAYGWILWSFFFFVFSILADHTKPMSKRILFMITRGLVVTAITFAIAAWWFIRSFLIHDGDLLGMRSANITAEKYAKPGYKPSDHWNPSRDRWSLYRFLIYQNPGWPHNWLILSWISFVGTFGHFDLYMEEGISKAYLAFMFFGIVMTVFMLNMYRLHPQTRTVTKSVNELGKVRTIVIQSDKHFSQEGIFHLFMILAMLTPMALYFYYAYFSDLQAQGRYFICSVFPLMYFVCCGFGILIRKLCRGRDNIARWIYRILAAGWLAGAVYNLFSVVIPHYL